MEVCLPFGRWYFPIHTIALVLTCIMLFYISDDHSDNLALELPIYVDQPPWEFVSCNIVHSDTTHLWNNIIMIMLFGTLFEMIHGPLVSSLVFWIGGSTGVLFEASFYLSTSKSSLRGASAGAFAMIGAYFGHLCINWLETPFRKAFFVALLSYTIVLVVLAFTDTENATRVIAHKAHWIGFTEGVLVSCIAVRNIRLEKWENLVMFSSLLLSAGLLVGISIRSSSVAKLT